MTESPGGPLLPRDMGDMAWLVARYAEHQFEDREREDWRLETTAGPVYVTFSREPMPGSTDEPLTVWPLPPSLRELLPSRAALYANRERLTGRKGNASGG